MTLNKKKLTARPKKLNIIKKKRKKGKTEREKEAETERKTEREKRYAHKERNVM